MGPIDESDKPEQLKATYGLPPDQKKNALAHQEAAQKGIDPNIMIGGQQEVQKPLEYLDVNGDPIQLGGVYLSIHNSNYLCYIGSEKKRDFGFLDVNGPDLKYASEMFNEWTRALVPIQNLEGFLNKRKESVEFLEMVKRQKHVEP